MNHSVKLFRHYARLEFGTHNIKSFLTVSKQIEIRVLFITMAHNRGMAEIFYLHIVNSIELKIIVYNLYFSNMFLKICNLINFF